MSDFLEKLLDGADVEWLPLEEIITFKRGKRLVKSQLGISGSYAVFQNSMTPLGYYNESNVKAESVFVICAGAAGDIGFSDNAFWAADDVYFAEQSEIVNSKFLYHFLLTQKHKIAGKVRRASIPRLSKSAIEKLIFPIPCPNDPQKSLAIQNEIVRILDTFTATTAELTAELTTRKKQYQYYRDTLLTFADDEVEWKTLGELCLIGDGLHGTPVYDESGDYYFINGNNLDNGNITFTEKTKKVNVLMFEKHGIDFEEQKTVFLSINGTVGNVAFYNNEKVVLGKSVAYFKIHSSDLHLRYLFYLFQTGFSKNYFEANKTGSTIKNLGLKALRTFKIPIPPLEKQAEIVAILDKFDTLTHSISEGLPKEIELRQKQYEYYRDALLSFPKPEEVEA